MFLKKTQASFIIFNPFSKYGRAQHSAKIKHHRSAAQTVH